MKAGEFPDGSRTLRAKIDMASPNFNMRDPVMYRILHAEHHRTGNEWCIYPMYDYAHGQTDSIEGITHSICTLEFEDHRPLYDWYIEHSASIPPQQIEFDRLNLTYTLLSKRKLLTLVQEGRVRGWDDPRMPTLSGIRRRGYTPEAIRNFCAAIGVSNTNGIIEIDLLEYYQSAKISTSARRRVMAVLRPLKVVIDNYPEGQVEEMSRPSTIPKTRRRHAQGALLRRALHRAGRLPRRSATQVLPPLSRQAKCACATRYFISAQSVVKDADGNIVEVHCTYDPASRGGNAPDGRKVKSTIHWVSAAHAISAEVRLYDKLFTKADPSDVAEGEDVLSDLNPNSLEILTGAKLEPSLANAKLGRPLPVRTRRLLLPRPRFNGTGSI